MTSDKQDDTPLNLGDAIKHLRRVHRLKQCDLAAKIGASETLLSSIENGKRPPPNVDSALRELWPELPPWFDLGARFANLGRAIAKARQALGWTRERLATEVGVTMYAVNAWERGVNAPRGAARLALSKHLGIDVTAPEFAPFAPVDDSAPVQVPKTPESGSSRPSNGASRSHEQLPLTARPPEPATTVAVKVMLGTLGPAELTTLGAAMRLATLGRVSTATLETLIADVLAERA